MKNFEDEFNTLIKKEKLNDLSIYFSDYESYEEIPLFSRYKNISFLSELSFNEKNKILIRKGIELIRHVSEVSLSYLKEDETEDYFICLSITDWDFDDYKEINCLSPHIYISRKKEWLLSCLELTQKNSIEENLVKEYLTFLDLNSCDVYVSGKCTNTNRVYILEQPID
ncbi:MULTISPECIES: Imm15 family immunity protein [Rahnella]|uniref:Uncharacterized protein n=1 Tax=Rahnella laticis TaxID=2787622 RepID=A0ABS0E0U3_9GAMM|nr:MULTISPECIES: Imm15 family immunity protein [Rahnella]MBF7977793.1 hypothetical protein [Rahnella laticis]MBF7998490.1 hypothetical protein [Rahnella sp. LAC-M12]